FFFLTRLTGSGARLTATAIAVSLLIGWRIETTIVVTVVVSIAYIATGGVSAIVWTNVFQALMFLVAGAATLGFLVAQIGGGAALFAFYAQHGAPAISRNDEVLPYFVGHAMPAFLRGLMLAAIVLASIDSPLGSLSASFVTDIYRPLIARSRSEAHYLRVSRVCVVIFGIVLGII